MNQSYRSELISQNAPVICYHCKQPIRIRKEFGMGLVKFGGKLAPFHIHCWAEFWANASFRQRFAIGPDLKLSAKTDKAMRQSTIAIATFYGAMSLGVFLLTGSSFLFILTAGFCTVIGGAILSWFSWTVNKQNKQWNKYIDLIPEEDL